jgi:hypothetical protein
MADVANMLQLIRHSADFDLVGYTDSFVAPTAVGWRALELDVMVASAVGAHLPKQGVRINLMHQALLDRAHASSLVESRVFERCGSAENMIAKLASYDFLVLYRTYLFRTGASWSVLKASKSIQTPTLFLHN